MTVTRPNGTTVSLSALRCRVGCEGWIARPQLLTSDLYYKQSASPSDLVEYWTHDWWSRSRDRRCAAQWLRLCLQLHPGHHHREGEGSAAGGERDRLHSQGDTAGRHPRRVHSNARRSGRTGAPCRSQCRRIRSNDDPLTYIWRAANGRFNGGVRTNLTTWDAAGLSPGQYTVTATVAERITGGQERTVVVNVARLRTSYPRCLPPPTVGGRTDAVPDDRGSVLRSVHDTHISNFRWFTTEVGARGASEVTLVGGGNSIWRRGSALVHNSIEG